MLEGNAKAIAEELKKPYATFMREVNPYDERAKLGVIDFVGWTRISGDFRGLDEIERKLGRVAFKVPAGLPTHHEINVQIK